MPSRLPLKDSKSKQEFLESCPTLAPLLEKHPRLAEQFEVRQYPRGHVFFSGRSQPSQSLWVVVWGRVEVHARRAHAPRLCCPHSSFGEESVIGSRAKPASPGLRMKLRSLLKVPSSQVRAARAPPWSHHESRAVALESTVVLELSAEGVAQLQQSVEARKHLRRARGIHRIAPRVVAGLAAARAFANVATDNLYQLISGAQRVIPDPTRAVLSRGEVPKDYLVLLEGSVTFVYPPGSAQEETSVTVRSDSQPLVIGADELLSDKPLSYEVRFITGGPLVRLSGQTLQGLRANDRRFAQSLMRLDRSRAVNGLRPKEAKELFVLLPCNPDEWGNELGGMADLLAEQIAANLCARVLVLHLLLPGEKRPVPAPTLLPVVPRPIGYAPTERFEFQDAKNELGLWVEYRYLQVDLSADGARLIHDEHQRTGQGGPADLTLVQIPPIKDPTNEEVLFETLRQHAGEFRLVPLLRRPTDLPPSVLLGQDLDMTPTAVLDSRPPGGIGPRVGVMLERLQKQQDAEQEDGSRGRWLQDLARDLGGIATSAEHSLVGAGEALLASTEQQFPKLAERLYAMKSPDMASGTRYQPWPLGTVRIHVPKVLSDALRRATRSLAPVTLEGLKLAAEDEKAVRWTFGHWARGVTASSVGLALSGGGAYGKVHPLLIQQLLQGGVPIDMISGSSVGSTVGAYYAVLGEPGLKRFKEDLAFISIAALFGILSSSFIEALMLVELGFVRMERSEIPFFPVVTDADTGIESDVRHGTYARGVRASGSLPPIGPTVLGDRRFLDGGLSANLPIGVLRLESADVVIAANCISTVQARKRRTPLPIPVLGRLLLESNPLLRMEDILRMIPLIFQAVGKSQDIFADVVFTANENANLNASDLNESVTKAQFRVRELLYRQPARVHLDRQGRLQVHGTVDFEPGTTLLQSQSRSLLNEVADCLNKNPEVTGTVYASVPPGAKDPNLGLHRAQAVVAYLKNRLLARKEGEETLLAAQGDSEREEVRFDGLTRNPAAHLEDLRREIFHEQTLRMQAELRARSRGLLLATEAQLARGDADLARLLALEAAIDPSADTDRVLRLVLARRGLKLDEWKTSEGDDVRVVSHAVLSPDGRYLATGGADGVVRVWDLEQPQEDGRPRKVAQVDHQGMSDPGIAGVAWSRAANGTLLLATAGFDSTLKLHSLGDDLQHLDSAYAGTWNQWGVAFSPGGARLLGHQGGPGSLAVWPLEAGRLGEPVIWTAPDAGDVVCHAAWSADGRRVAVGTERGTVFVWEPETGASATVDAPGGRIFRMAWHPERDALAVASAKALHLYVREGDTDTWKAYSKTDHEGQVHDVAWSSDGCQLLSAGEDGGAYVWDVVPTGLSRWRSLRGGDEPLTGAAWHADGGYVVTWGSSGAADVWSPQTGHRLASFTSHEGAVTQAAWCRDNHELLTASEEGLVRRWDPSHCGQVSFSPHRRGIECVAWRRNPAEPQALSTGLDGAVHLWNPRTGERVRTLQDAKGAPGQAWAAWSPDGQWLATMRRGAPGPSFFRASDGVPVGSAPEATSEPVEALESRKSAGPQLAFSPDGRWLAVRHATKVSVWDVASHQQVDEHESPDGKATTWLAWHPGSTQLAFSTWSRAAVHLVELDAQGKGQPRTLLGHNDGVWRVAYSPDGKWLATACNDSHLRIFDSEGKTPRHKLKHTHAVRTVAWAPQATAGTSLLAFGDTSQAGALLSVTEAKDTGALTLTPLTRRETSVEESRDLAWSPDGKRLAAASSSGRIHLWSEQTLSSGNSGWVLETTLRAHSSGVSSLAFSEDGKWLISGGDDGRALVHPVDFQTLLEAVKQLPGRRELTAEERRLYVSASLAVADADAPRASVK